MEPDQTNKTVTPVTPKKSKRVTSDATIDWPELGWGIHAGETLDLPTDAEAQKVILSSPHIKSANE